MNTSNPVASAGSASSHGKVETADVVVIGAGSIGTPTALALAAEGLRVVVLDKQKSVGQGSNKAAIGGVRATHSDPSKIQLCNRSLHIFSTWKETFGHDIEWVTGGYLFPAYREQDESTLKNLLTIQQAHGLAIEWLDRERLLEVAPDLNRSALRGGTFSPNDGHCSPLLALHALFERAQTLGAIFRFEEPVTEVLHENGKVTGVRTHRSQIATNNVVNAAGVWSSDIGGLPPGSDLPVKPDAHEAGITEAVAPFLGPLVVDIRPGPGSANCYFFQHKHGQVIFCLTPSPLIWGDDTRETSTFLPMAARRLLDVMPRLSALRVRRTWRGLYPMTPDGLPLVGFSTHLQGYFVAGGMCGQGFMLGPAVGELIARSLLKKSTPEDLTILHALRPDRPIGGKAEQLK